MRILLIVSAPAYMSPSPRDHKYISALERAGLKVPSLDIEKEPVYLRAVPPFSRRARDLFQGFFKKIMKRVRIARSQGIGIDVYLISPRYGLLREDEVVLPHAVDMRSLTRRDLEELSKRLGIGEKLSKILQQPYDILILILKKDHLPLIRTPKKELDLPRAPPRIILISAPSLAGALGEGIEFIGIKQIGKRAEEFIKLIDSMTIRTLKDYSA
ncbi:MAG: hypothetical protein ACUVQ5_01285 [Candidatus Methanomethylicaceae archaeon]